MPRLGNRLLLIAGMIAPGSRVADIGTDHAVLPIHLVRSGKAEWVIASDIAKKPLQKAAENVDSAGLSDRIQLRLCDGLEGIAPHEVDTIVIAGMGGELIAEIIEAAPWLREGNYTLLLQPMSRPERLREYLCAHGFTYESEMAGVDAGRNFSVIKATTEKSDHQYPSYFNYTGLLYKDITEDNLSYLLRCAATLRVRAEDIPSHLRESQKDYAELCSAAEYIENLINKR